MDRSRFLWILVICAKVLMLVRGQQIEKLILTETRTAGEEGSLTCTVSEKDPQHSLIWLKLGATVFQNKIISTNTKVITSNPRDNRGIEKYEVVVRELTEFMLEYTLKVRRLQDTDSGFYECYMLVPGDPEGDWPRGRGELIVQLPPSLTNDIEAFVKVAVGGTAKMFCDASGVPRPRISWTRANGGALAIGGTIFRGKTLVLKNVTSKDRGTYRCRAENDVKPPATSDVTLDIEHAPDVRPFRNSVGQAPGRNFEVRMSCLISGNPEPVTTWYRLENLRKVALEDSEKYQVDRIGWMPGSDMKIKEFWLELVIKNVGDGDAGLYQCEARNQFGTSSANISLFMTTTCQKWKCWKSAVLSSGSEMVHMYQKLFFVIIFLFLVSHL